MSATFTVLPHETNPASKSDGYWNVVCGGQQINKSGKATGRRTYVLIQTCESRWLAVDYAKLLRETEREAFGQMVRRLATVNPGWASVLAMQRAKAQ